MKKMFVIAGVFAFAFCAFSQEFATFSDAHKAGMAAYKAKDYAKMQEIYANWNKKASSDYQKWCCFYFESRAFREMKKWDDALKVADAYISSNPVENNKFEALFVKGLIYIGKGDDASAIPCFEEAIKSGKLLASSRLQAYRNLIYASYRQRKFDLCADACRQLLAGAKGYDLEFAYNFGTTALCDAKKFSECEQMSKEGLAIVKNPEFRATLLYNYAQSLLSRNEEDEAMKYLQECVKLAPNTWRAKTAKKLLQDLE